MAGASNPANTQPNVFGQAAQGLQMAGQGTIASGMGPNIAQFQNPYTQDVIQRTEQDIARQREMAMNQLGAQAGAAGAFGGSRHGVAEGVLGGEYARMAGDMAAQQRQAGFNTALGAAQNQQGIGLQAAGQLGNLAQTGFGMGMGINQQQMQQGMMQQALQQQIIDAARAQYGGFTGAPQASLGLPMAALGAANMGQQSQTATRQPGLFDFLGLGASTLGGLGEIAKGGGFGALFPSDPRLKTNVRTIGKRNGIKLYSWDWSEEGKRIASPGQPTVGVMADELMETHPHLVVRGSDGYLRVNYGGLQL
jgi:hypothetical protein